MVSFLAGYGYDLRTGSGGSRHKFFNGTSKHVVSCHKPHGSKPVRKGAIEDIRESLREVGVI